ncbi:helix-turn-helix domain-containing protein [Enterococcus faecalis]|uniref:Helix-turn-helix domain-containing protein n=1 Tax=Enterococcus faecalis TaxID=1351 RepID=A0ABD7J0Q7_ENTFL|nr:helix-turn-helix domain-containing protein [Enterococcus faecalis]EGO2743584.1 helix-turn-helix domain-containing protein [Enterococcus faecalis]EGO2803412.1 helix-turn-helix domain-containing protein [Enterococcus faecalis]EGO2811904.1 helix-turn-helix domain-containing protein [Enterococcus faecalis]EGO2831329.1 helix-turn-helix domain-containing protein [Enterococcus faecalis]EGO5087806.1 helix-turn-helix domain-containing protein [Enterococcus faecalis]
MKELIDLVIDAKAGNEEAMLELLQRFEPLFLKEATRCGQLDLDCLQELREHFIEHIYKYEIRCNCIE